jgi:hypothetical protein
MPAALPPLLLVPAKLATIAARHDVVTRHPQRPVMNIPRRELTLSCSHAPPGL